MVVFKLNLAKAYDKTNCDLLDYVMLEMGMMLSGGKGFSDAFLRTTTL